MCFVLYNSFIIIIIIIICTTSSFNVSVRKLTLNEQIGAFVSRDATTVQCLTINCRCLSTPVRKFRNYKRSWQDWHLIHYKPSV